MVSSGSELARHHAEQISCHRARTRSWTESSAGGPRTAQSGRSLLRGCPEAGRDVHIPNAWGVGASVPHEETLPSFLCPESLCEEGGIRECGSATHSPDANVVRVEASRRWVIFDSLLSSLAGDPRYEGCGGVLRELATRAEGCVGYGRAAPRCPARSSVR